MNAPQIAQDFLATCQANGYKPVITVRPSASPTVSLRGTGRGFSCSTATSPACSTPSHARVRFMVWTAWAG